MKEIGCRVFLMIVSNYRDLCKEILNLDGVRSTTIITMQGTILFSDSKQDMQPLLSRQDAALDDLIITMERNPVLQYMLCVFSHSLREWNCCV
jgi:hypothetical protein